MRLVLMLVLLFCSTALAAVKTVRVPDGGIEPQAAVDAKGVIHLIYFKGADKAGDVYYTTSKDAGATFAKSIRVNSEPNSAIATGTIRGAHLALGKGDRPHVAWMGSHAATPKAPGNETPMLYTRLGDDGSFEPQRNVIVEHVGMDGGGSIAADDAGNVYVAWHAPEKKEGDEASRRVWVAKSSDDGKTFAAETAAGDGGTGACACCSLRAYAGKDGLVMIAYRRARDMTDRGTSLLVSGDGGKTFKTQKVDDMNSGKCIMSSFNFVDFGKGHALLFENDGRTLLQALNADGSMPFAAKPLGPGKHAVTAMIGEFGVVARVVGSGWNKGGKVAWAELTYLKPGKESETPNLPTWSYPAAVGLASGDFLVIY